MQGVRLIDAGALIRYISNIERDDDDKLFTFEEIKKMLRNAPTIEPEVRHGLWEDNGEDKFICSACKGYVYRWFGKSDFCPNCGAKMDADEKPAEKPAEKTEGGEENAGND